LGPNNAAAADNTDTTAVAAATSAEPPSSPEATHDDTSDLTPQATDIDDVAFSPALEDCAIVNAVNAIELPRKQLVVSPTSLLILMLIIYMKMIPVLACLKRLF
jgi:hypothetical protein